MGNRKIAKMQKIWKMRNCKILTKPRSPGEWTWRLACATTCRRRLLRRARFCLRPARFCGITHSLLARLTPHTLQHTPYSTHLTARTLQHAPCSTHLAAHTLESEIKKNKLQSPSICFVLFCYRFYNWFLFYIVYVLFVFILFCQLFTIGFFVFTSFCFVLKTFGTQKQ